ncbi:hypothetical protein KKQ10_25670 [Pseudomonas sp. MG-9]|uniref:hypothetical protein n=1 Tax=Pseudomonas sp. MG-9 TaxID=2839032 RepID=UPI001C006565|nr:hypothetical protein [Pseudomonas sp. MG-9]MBT9268273.1 hypothetical protein [Pseudomonas sp. MG-9]
MTTQYAYYRFPRYFSEKDFHQIVFVGVKRGADAMVSQTNNEKSVQCSDDVKVGWHYQPSTGTFISPEELEKNREKYEATSETV